MGDLGEGFEDVLATPDLVMGLLTPATGSGAVPQMQAGDGTWVQDSSDIIDYVEARHDRAPVIPSVADVPRQALASYLVELLADEWMVVPGFSERWHYSLSDVEPNHVAYNAMQWGSVFAAGAPGKERLAAGAALFEGQWLADDRVPPSLDAVVAVFFEEMWPMLTSTMEKTAAYIASDDHSEGGELPGKTFLADMPWIAHQTGDGALTHEFEIGGINARRMVTPYRMWMLQRPAGVLEKATAGEAGRTRVRTWLEQFRNGGELLELNERLADCRVRKQGARLFSFR